MARFFLKVIAPSRRDAAIEALEAEYVRRLTRHVQIEVTRVRPGDTAAAEAERIGARTPARARRVALDIAGESWTSEQLARYVGAARDGGVAGIAFWIGGADGLDPALLREADHRLSLGPMTLAHRVARVVLVEQLYRAISILRGEPYHRA